MACRRGPGADTARRVRPFIQVERRRARLSAASVSFGSIATNGSMRSRSKLKFGGNCQMIGPSFSPRLKTPEAKKFDSGVCTSRRRLIWVTYRGPFTVKTKSSGVASRQRA